MIRPSVHPRSAKAGLQTWSWDTDAGPAFQASKGAEAFPQTWGLGLLPTGNGLQSV